MIHRTVAAAAAGLLLAVPSLCLAHATYNVTGYGAGIGGSANGVDGGLPPTWTNGPIEEYHGSLPVNWYLGMHAAAGARSIQSGAGANPPAGSLLAQITSYNLDNEPDLATDRVLAVGGKSWVDPENDNQGWGHGLDYGIIHLSPIDTILAGGPVKMTITVADDPSDGVAPRLAFALYSGWDEGNSSVRHQSFTTSPSPAAQDPLGSTGLQLIDFLSSTAHGGTISRTYDVDAADLGKYTIFIGAQGGISGQYILTLTLEPDAALGTCEAALADSDDDGILDAYDTCEETPADTDVDSTGCSRAQFCATFDAMTEPGRRACVRADWKNDQSVLPKRGERDCKSLTTGSDEDPVRTCIERVLEEAQ